MVLNRVASDQMAANPPPPNRLPGWRQLVHSSRSRAGQQAIRVGRVMGVPSSLAVTLDESVVAAERVGLFKAAIGADGRAEILVTEKQPNRFVLARVRTQKQQSGQMSKSVRVEIDSDLLPNCALDLLGKLRRRLGADGARRKQKPIGSPASLAG